ncbi:MAG TPA: homoserine kinase [Actinomycetota bacterium]|jgi:homoserine kinase|nr:homoserine kinase [Actinomycetota bacterium]
MRVTVRVPATSANLGPGFDTFGLALDLCNDVTVDTDAPSGVTWEGEGADELAVDGSDLVSTTMAAIASSMDTPLPSLALHGVNRIPLARGLGSSSAATVAGVVLASRVLDLGIDRGDAFSVFAEAAGIEGHPDNAAPAVFGGLTIAVDGAVHRLEPHPELRAVVLVPSVRLDTASARDALPDRVSMADAVFNLGHAALLVEALTTDPALLQEALRDRLHQDARLELVPEMADQFDRIQALRRVPVCVSGAGPSLIAFPLDGAEIPPEALEGPGEWRAVPLGIRREGFTVDA